MILPVRPHFIFDMLDNADSGAMPFKLHAPIRQSGSPTILELFLLLSVGRLVDAGTILEIGTFRGATTRALAINFPHSKIKTLDLHTRLSDDLLCEFSNVERHQGHSCTFDFSRLEPQHLIFIDGGHDYETACSDSENAKRLVADGGAIVWHDYNDPEWEVTRAVVDFAAEHPDFPVYSVEGTHLAIAFRK
jgi:Methyltransferase domain